MVVIMMRMMMMRMTMTMTKMMTMMMIKMMMKTSPSSLSMEARVLAIRSESRLSTSLGDLAIIMGMMIKMVTMEMMMMTIGRNMGLTMEMVTMRIRRPGYYGTILP